MRQLSRRASNHLVIASVVLGVLGAVSVVLGLSADRLGLGDGVVFGPRQMSAVVRGALALVLAVYVCLYGLVERHRVLRPVLRAARPVALVLLVCATLEAVVQAVGIVRAYSSPSIFLHPRFVEDDRLGFRFPARSRGHDAWGFRNPETASDPEIIAIGDSMTWGVNAAMETAWPSVLSRASGASVYNMGVPGYGPVQYQILSQQAVALSPDVIVLTLYWGNDLLDAYGMVYGRAEHAKWRRSGSPFAFRHKASTSGAQVRAAVPRQGQLRSLRNVITRSALVTGMGLAAYQLCSSGDGRATVLSYQKRIVCVDLLGEEAREGLRLTKIMLTEIAHATGAAGINLLIVAIPTKESAYTSAMPTVDQARTLMEMETKLSEEISALCRRLGIVYADALPVLRDAVAEGGPVYTMTSDGHPTAHGYAVIADFVHQVLRTRGWVGD